MKYTLVLFLGLMGCVHLAFGSESPRAAAVSIILSRQENTITIYGKDPSPEDRVALEARNRLERFLVSEKADEAITISYAILIIDEQLSIIKRFDSTGDPTSRLKAQKQALARRLIEIDNAGQGGGTSTNNP